VAASIGDAARFYAVRSQLVPKIASHRAGKTGNPAHREWGSRSGAEV
jgi:hypothetical protein